MDFFHRYTFQPDAMAPTLHFVCDNRLHSSMPMVLRKNTDQFIPDFGALDDGWKAS
jgi:hypothetical protein